MKIAYALAALGTIATTAVVAAPAEAQRYGYHRFDHRGEYGRPHYRGYSAGYYGRPNGYGYGWRHRGYRHGGYGHGWRSHQRYGYYR